MICKWCGKEYDNSKFENICSKSCMNQRIKFYKINSRKKEPRFRIRENLFEMAEKQLQKEICIGNRFKYNFDDILDYAIQARKKLDKSIDNYWKNKKENEIMKTIKKINEEKYLL